MQRYNFEMVYPERDPFSDHAPSACAEAVPSPRGDYVRHCDAQAEIDKLKKTISGDEDDLTAVYMKGRADGKGSASAEIAQLKAERDNAERKFLEESRIVDRVWRALGVSDYASADGKSIDEIVSSLRADLAAARAALAVELEACGFYRQAHESCVDEFAYGTPAPVDRRCDDCIDYDARRSAEAKSCPVVGCGCDNPKQREEGNAAEAKENAP